MHSIVSVVLVVAFVLTISSASAKTIQWTAAGGNPLWDSPNNWDSYSVPTMTDDDVIDVANIAGNVRVGSGTAMCNSITVGGSSGTAQSLTIFTGFNIGPGGATIKSNGQIILNASPTTPLTTAGVFNGANKFVFISGTLGGKGSFSFTNVPFNGTALKVINTTVTVSGVLDVSPMTGSAVINIEAKSSLVVTGTLSTSATVTLASAKSGSLQVQGTLSYTGGQTDTFTILGDANIASLNIGSGTMIFNDNETVVSANIASGATITLIGSSYSIRKFGTVTGSGILNIQGGTNSFSLLNSVGTVMLSGGFLNANDKASSITTLQQTGGVIEGGAPLTIGSATLTNADITVNPVSATVLHIHGFTQIVGTSVTVTSSAVIEVDSQFTLSEGGSFIVGPQAQVTQSGAFQILPAGGTKVPTFTNNGRWSSSISDLKVLVNTAGTGAFQFGSGGSIEITGVVFNAGSLTLATGAKYNQVSATVTIGSVQGSGTIITNGQSFVVTGSLAAASVTVQNGLVSAAGTSITSLDIQFGNFNITGATAGVSTLVFEGGSIGGSVSAGTVLTVDSLTLTGTQPKTFANLVTVFSTFDLNCAAPQCQLFTTVAQISSSKSWKSQ